MKHKFFALLFLASQLHGEDATKAVAAPKPVSNPSATEVSPQSKAPANTVPASKPSPAKKKTKPVATPTPTQKPPVVVAPPPPAPVAPDFHKQVRGILEVSCVRCHGPEKQKGELRLGSLVHAKKGGDSGAALVAGNASKSLLLERINLPDADEDVMPPKSPHLTSTEKEILNRWIQTGANWPKGVTLASLTPKQLVARQAAEKKPIVELAVYPPQVNLETKKDFHK
ncbi:MAG: hypothetical protein HOA16_10460, partial [Opitutae bacterium]|nr:hypothetical protein [Opitutae bacterium]